MSARSEVVRITISMTVACALGALILGGVYIGTERYQRAAALASERRAITEMLGVAGAPSVVEVRATFDEAREAVVYDARPLGEADAPGRRIAFALDGRVLERGATPEAAPGRAPEVLSRLFVVNDGDHRAGWVVEGESRGYKNRIRFLVAIDPTFQIAGVRVVEHEEDPGLGAEVATPWFQGQFIGRPAAGVERLDVTRDPMPEDWRVALNGVARTPAGDWRAKHGALLDRERPRPIYAVTGATISSRALTTGVRTAVDHFRRRWALLAPWIGGSS